MAAQELAQQEAEKLTGGIKGWFRKFMAWIRKLYRSLKEITGFEGPIEKARRASKESLTKNQREVRHNMMLKDGPTHELSEIGPLTEDEMERVLVELDKRGIIAEVSNGYVKNWLGKEPKNLSPRALRKANEIKERINKLYRERDEFIKGYREGNSEKARATVVDFDRRIRDEKTKYDQLIGLAYSKHKTEKCFNVRCNKSRIKVLEDLYAQILKERSPAREEGYVDYSLSLNKLAKGINRENAFQKLPIEDLYEGLRQGVIGMEVFNRQCAFGTVDLKEATESGNYFAMLLSGKEVEALIESRQLDKDCGINYCIFRDNDDFNPDGLDLDQLIMQGKNVNEMLDPVNGRYKVIIELGEDRAFEHLNPFLESYANVKHGLKSEHQLNNGLLMGKDPLYGKSVYTVKDHQIVVRNPNEKEIAEAVLNGENADMKTSHFLESNMYVEIDQTGEVHLEIVNGSYVDTHGHRQELTDGNLEEANRSLDRLKAAEMFQDDQRNFREKLNLVEDRARQGKNNSFDPLNTQKDPAKEPNGKSDGKKRPDNPGGNGKEPSLPVPQAPDAGNGSFPQKPTPEKDR